MRSRSKTAQAVENVRNLLPLSGVDPEGVAVMRDTWLQTTVTSYIEFFGDCFVEAFGPDGFEAPLRTALVSVAGVNEIDEMMVDAPVSHYAAFGLVLIDRWVLAASKGTSGWEAVWHFQQAETCASEIERRELLAKIAAIDLSAKEVLSNAGRRAAFAKHRQDPKQLAKAFVRECWETWRQHPEQYKNASAFARSMQDKHPETLQSEAVIVRWVREWSRAV